MKHTTHTVITGDVVGSTNVEDWSGLQQRMEEILDNIKNKGVDNRQKNPYEIFQGDSFQVLVVNPVNALVFALLIRAGLRSFKKDIKEIKKLPDARISIGVGGIEDMTFDNFKQARGEVFELSKKGLEKLEHSDNRLAIQTPWNEVNDEMKVACKLTDAVIDDWSYYSSELMYFALLYEEKQMDLAKRLKINQSNVARRMKYAHMAAIKLFINRFRQIIKRKSERHGTQ